MAGSQEVEELSEGHKLELPDLARDSTLFRGCGLGEDQTDQEPSHLGRTSLFS